MRFSRLLIVSALAVAVFVPATACGSSDSGGGSASDATTTTSAAPDESTTTTATDEEPSPSTGTDPDSPFCVSARETTETISDMFEATATKQDDAALLAESKEFFAQVSASLETLDAKAPAEIEEDIAYLKDLFVAANAKAQKATTADDFDEIASGVFGMDSPEYTEHNDNVSAYFKETCGIGAEAEAEDSTTTTTAG